MRSFEEATAGGAAAPAPHSAATAPAAPPASGGAVRAGLAAFAVVLVTGALAAGTVLAGGFGIAERALRRDSAALAEIVARSAARDLSRAAELGLPLASLPGTDAYLEQLVARSGGVSRLDVVGPDGRRLHSVERGGGAASGFLVVRADIVGPKGPAGAVLASASLAVAAAPFVETGLIVGAIVFAAALLSGILTGLAAHRLVVAPTRQLSELLRGVTTGGVTTRFPSGLAPDAAPIATEGRQRVRRILDGWRSLAGYAGELELSDFDGRNAGAISAVVADLRSRFSLPYLIDTTTSRSGSASDPAR